MWTRLLKNNLIYAVGSIANSAGLFLLIPFLVNTLSPAEFGAWSIYEIIVLLLVILITAGMDIGLMRHYWFMNDEEERRRLGGTVLMAVTIWGLFLFILFCLGYQLISNSPLFNQFHVEEFSSTSLLLVYQIGFFEALFTIFLAIFRIREQAVLFVLLSISKMLLFIGGGIAGEKLTGNINGVLAGRLLAAIFDGFYAMGYH
jgi:O-antigen/teichoic acid export membrane protein